MHSSEILHRDLKPGMDNFTSINSSIQFVLSMIENILIRENQSTKGKYEIKVIDFGLSFKNE